jgi:hypothetical protein
VPFAGGVCTIALVAGTFAAFGLAWAGAWARVALAFRPVEYRRARRSGL